MIVFNAISSRIVKHTVKSVFFWITFASLILVTIIVDSFFLIKIKGTQSQPGKVVGYNYLIYALLTFFIILFEIFFANRFWMMDKSNGILNIEYRNDISMNKIFWTRFTLNKLILLAMMLSFYLINVAFFSFVNNTYFQINLLNQIMVLIGILAIDMFVSSIFIIIAQYKKQILLGIFAGVFILVLSANSPLNLLTDLSNESYLIAEQNIKYQTTKKSHNLYWANDYFNSLVKEYSLLPKYLEQQNKQKDYNLSESLEDYVKYLTNNGAYYYFSLYKDKFYNGANYNTPDFKDNKIYQLVKESNTVLNLDSQKSINDTSSSIKEIWSNSYFSINSTKNISLDGKYNFNEVIKKLKTDSKNDKEKLEIINFVDYYCKNILTMNRDSSSFESTNSWFVYGVEHGEGMNSLEETVKDTNMTPGVMLFEKALLDIVDCFYKVTKNYGNEVKDNDNEFVNSQMKKLYLKTFVNPFFVINQMQTFSYFNNKYQENLLLSSFQGLPSDNYIYYDFVFNNQVEETNFPEESMIKGSGETNLRYLIGINFLLCYIILTLVLLISFAIFKKRLQI